MMSSLVRLATKELGAYYTPDTIAEILADWVVQTGRESLLEPSIGNGALVSAVLSCAEQRWPGSHDIRLFGCDLDESAISEVRGWLAPKHLLVTGNFLDINPELIEPVHGVIANPPFTRNHAISKPLRDALRQRFSIKGAAGLWVAFLYHAMSFLRPDGRLAAVIPGAAIFSGYGREALSRICVRFEHVEIRQIVGNPRWSSHAEECGALVLARGYGSGASSLPQATRWSSDGKRLADNHYLQAAYFRQALLGARRLGDVARLSIGVVTGSNKIFLLSEADRLAAGIETDDLRLVAARSRHAQGLQVSAEDLRSLAGSGERTWLLTPRDVSKFRPGVRARLAQISASKRRAVAWFNKRTPWWRIDINGKCDAFFTYMNDVGPRVVIANDDVFCTNTLHQVCFMPNISREERFSVSLSMISSFGQLAAEHVGRPYGGGVLKFELIDARDFPILLRASSRIEPAFQEADQAMRSGDTDKARTIADELLLPFVFGSSWQIAALDMMERTLQMRSARRDKSR